MAALANICSLCSLTRSNSRKLWPSAGIVSYSLQQSRKNTSTSKTAQPDYSSLQSNVERPSWAPQRAIKVTKTAKPQWKYGSGANSSAGIQHQHIGIDPHAEDRTVFSNYTLLISGIAPRPIALLSTVSTDGKENLAPFSYFQVVDHNPPVFIVGFTGRTDRPKDSLRNLQETGECVINTVSEHMIEAVNATSLDAPSDTSEWAISGLHKAQTTTVKPARVKESIFSIEGKLLKIIDFDTITPATGPHGRLAIIQGTKFWVREDAIDKAHSDINLEVLRPVGQLGGISYARMTDTFELPRSKWATAMGKEGQTLAALADLHVRS